MQITPLPGYAIFQEVSKKGKYLIYRGVRESDQKPVFIKTFESSRPLLEEIARIKNEYQILKSLDSPYFIKAYALEEMNNNFFLILEDTQEATLDKMIRSQPPSMEENLLIAISLSKALAEMQQKDIIHRDIQPENIWVDPTDFSIKLAGFSYATKTPKQTLAVKNLSLHESTLAYMSPEETGRTNTPVDYRTDFYSFGVTLYKMFTHKLPFQGLDSLELVYAQIAKPAPRPEKINPAIPEVVGNLIMKLMNKKAEARYQSAQSLTDDLKRCLDEYKLTGKVELFPLGIGDISQKLQVSTKIYGRQREISHILRLFDEVCAGSTQLVLLSGYPGIGKSSIVGELHRPLIERHAFFITGRYDPYKKNIPYSGFIEAFQELIQLILTESEEVILMWKEKLKAALGVNARVIVDVVPELSYILGEIPPGFTEDTQEMQNRFNFFFQKFISLYATPETPLVLFLDDLQWADAASLNLIEMILTNLRTSGLLLIGAYRNHDTPPLHPLKSMISRITHGGGMITEIDVPPLSLENLEEMMVDTLHQSKDKCRTIAKVIFEKVRGNPFFAIQFLTFLYDKRLLYKDNENHAWQWDIEQIEKMEVSENVVDLLVSKLQGCSSELRRTLEIASCIGSEFDIKLLLEISGVQFPLLVQTLIEGIREGFILAEEDIQPYQWVEKSEDIKNVSFKPFKFLHNRIQQACYQLLNPEEREEFHYQIGSYLQHKYKDDEHVFEIISQLNSARRLIVSPKEQKECAQMNLTAATKAIRTAAFETAANLLQIGISFLPENKWKDDYTLTLNLFTLYAETQYFLCNFEEASNLFDQVLEHAQSDTDKVMVCTRKVRLFVNSANYKEAIKWGREGLKLLGVHLPTGNLKFHLLWELVKVKWSLFNKDPESLLTLPTLQDKKQLEMMQLFYMLIPPAYLSSRELFAFVVLKGLNLTLKYGNGPMTPYIYASYGIILNGLFENLKGAYSFGKLALALNGKFEDKQYVPPTRFLVGTFLLSVQKPLKDSIEILQKGFEIATAKGDFINAVFCLGMMFTNKYLTAQRIELLAKEGKTYLDYVAKIKSHNRGYIFNTLDQVFLALTGNTYSPSSLQTNDFNEEVFFKMLKDNNFLITLYFAYTFKMQLCFLFEDYEKGVEMGKKAEEFTFCVTGQPMRLENDFYYALLLTTQYPFKDKSTRKKYSQKLHEITKRLYKWANDSPSNFRHKYLLIQAEWAKLKNWKEKAVEYYEQAIVEARDNGYLQNEGIANELFAKFYLSQNRHHLAKQYLIDAHYAFYRWGATAKLAHLEKKYKGSLSQMLQREEGSVFSSSPANNELQSSPLDLMTVVKATQSLSGEIVLSKLIDQMIRIVIENAGADKAMLILEKGDVWLVEAEFSSATGGKTIRPSIPFKDKKESLPVSVINYIFRTKELVLIDDPSHESIFSLDPYLVKHPPQSILCVPLLHQGKLVGILYLENSLTPRAFTPARLELLKLLGAQIAASLENSLLYSSQAGLTEELKLSNEKLEDYSHNLEKKVYDRTRELNEKNRQLEETLQQIKEMQKKLIQQEKLVSTATVTKGIATEMRNPLNYIFNFATLAQNSLKELGEHPPPEIEKELMAIIQTNLEKVAEHGHKADAIIASMLEQSRDSEKKKESTDINKLIRDYADLVYYTYYKDDPLFSLTIETNYDPSLGPMDVFPQSLGRVFYNVIDNACYATDQKKKKIGGNYSPRLSIQTKNYDDHASIVIKDNGTGIPPDILARVFSPFLTTKPSGKSAGMGLSISQDIIVQDHGGLIEIKSEEGQFTEVTITIPKFAKK